MKRTSQTQVPSGPPLHLAKQIQKIFIERLVKIEQGEGETVKARFNGKCVECGEAIKIGKEILKNSKEK